MDYRRLGEVLEKILRNTEDAKKNGNAAGLFAKGGPLVLGSRAEGGGNAQNMTWLRFGRRAEVDPGLKVPVTVPQAGPTMTVPPSPAVPGGTRRSSYWEYVPPEPPALSPLQRPPVPRPRIPRGISEYGQMAYQLATTQDAALKRRLLNRLGKSPITQNVGGIAGGLFAGSAANRLAGGGVLGSVAGTAVGSMTASKIAGGFGAAAGITAIALLAKSALDAGKKLHDFAVTTVESRRELAEWHPGTAMAFARADYQQRIMDVEMARKTMQTTKAASEAVIEMKKSLQPYRIAWANIANYLAEKSAQAVAGGLGALSPAAPDPQKEPARAMEHDRNVEQMRRLHPEWQKPEHPIQKMLGGGAAGAPGAKKLSKEEAAPWAVFLNDLRRGNFEGHVQRPRKPGEK